MLGSGTRPTASKALRSRTLARVRRLVDTEDGLSRPMGRVHWDE